MVLSLTYFKHLSNSKFSKREGGDLTNKKGDFFMYGFDMQGHLLPLGGLEPYDYSKKNKHRNANTKRVHTQPAAKKPDVQEEQLTLSAVDIFANLLWWL